MALKTQLLIKRVAMLGLVILGLLEMLSPISMSLLFDAYEPPFRNTFDASKLTEQQQQLVHKFRVQVYRRSREVFYFGCATAILAGIIYVADRRRKADA